MHPRDVKVEEIRSCRVSIFRRVTFRENQARRFRVVRIVRLRYYVTIMTNWTADRFLANVS